MTHAILNPRNNADIWQLTDDYSLCLLLVQAGLEYKPVEKEG